MKTMTLLISLLDCFTHVIPMCVFRLIIEAIAGFIAAAVKPKQVSPGPSGKCALGRSLGGL
jgi:hypothetical protein